MEKHIIIVITIGIITIGINKLVEFRIRRKIRNRRLNSPLYPTMKKLPPNFKTGTLVRFKFLFWLRLFFIKDEEEPTNSIIDEIYDSKKKQNDHALILVYTSIGLYSLTNIFFHIDFKIEVFIFLYVLSILIIMSKLLVSYRIKKGYYGMNFEECKELILYLMDNQDKNDKNKGKKIFNELDDYNKAREESTVVVGELP